MNDYKFEHSLPTIEHYLTEYKDKSVCIYTPYGADIEFRAWAANFFNGVYYIKKLEHNVMACNIAYVNERTSPYELLNLLCNAYDNLKPGGILICNYFFDNKPLDEFENNPRYGIDAFSFVIQHRTDILYKGNQIIFKKLG